MAKATIKKVLSKDVHGATKYYDWVVCLGKQCKVFYGYRRKPKLVEKEAREFYNDLKTLG